MNHLQQTVLHARVVENRLRRDFSTLHPVIEIEVVPEGFAVKAVAGDEDKVFSVREVVSFEAARDELREVVDVIAQRMRRRMER